MCFFNVKIDDTTMKRDPLGRSTSNFSKTNDTNQPRNNHVLCVSNEM